MKAKSQNALILSRPESLADLFANRYQPEEIPLASKATLKHWMLALRAFAEFLQAPPTVSDLTETNLVAAA